MTQGYKYWAWVTDRLTQAVCLLVVVWLFYLTLLPTEQRWTETDGVLAFAIPVIFTIAACLRVRRRRTAITMSDVIVALWFIYYVGRTWYGAEYCCRTEFLKVTETFLLYFSLRLLFSAAPLAGRQIIVLVLVSGCYEALLGALQMCNGTGRHHLFALTGSFQNPGPYSAYIMLGVVVGLAALRTIKDGDVPPAVLHRLPPRVAALLKVEYLRYLLLAAIVIMMAILPSTWSRAAFFAVTVIVLWIYRRCYWRYRFAVWTMMILPALLLYYIKQGSADGRLVIWQAAWVSWLASTWFGTGIGGFCHAVAEGMGCIYASGIDITSAGVTDNSYNILLKILVEQGIVGVLFALVLVVSVLRELHSHSRPLYYGIVSLLLFAMFSYPFDLLPYRIVAVLVVAWSETHTGYSVCKAGRAAGFMISLLLAFAGWHTYKAIQKSSDADEEYSFIKGMHDKEFISGYYEILEIESDNPEFLFDLAKALRNAGRYNDSNAILRRGMRCSADPMFHVLTGNNYKDMRIYGMAEQSYMMAFRVMPNRIYPLYQLMLLYEDIGDKDKMRDMAVRIVNMKPKIVSPATKEMQDKARMKRNI